MKAKDIIGLIIAVVILGATGIIFWTQLAPVPAGTGITVEIPPKVIVPLSNEEAVAGRDTLRAAQDYARPQEIRVCTGDSDSACIGKNGIFQP